MPPCFDVYIWVTTDDRAAVLSRFIDQYVAADHPGEPRFDAFVRTFVTGDPAPGDIDSLAELRRDESAVDAFSIYLRAKAHEAAIITFTEEGQLVLGLSIDDPNNAPHTRNSAAELMSSLCAEFGALGGVAGVELAPPQSRSEWQDDALVLLREGSV